MDKDAVRPLLSIRRLAVHFPAPRSRPWQAGGVLKAVDGVDLDLAPGATLGLVGESGCGKSTLARALTGLQPITAGKIEFDGRDLSGLGAGGWRGLRRDIQMVFQDPLASLNPRLTVGEIVAEPLRHLFPGLKPGQRWERVASVLERVGLSPRLRNRYPHEFSGGQCQRIGIARALVVEPRLLVCDEPVSALDVSIQAQILELLARVQAELGIAIVFIAHDLAVVRKISDRVVVMYLGRIMESATVAELFERPVHPYSRALLSAVPRPDPDCERRRRRILLDGELPSPTNPPSGCFFRTRCPWAQAVCARTVPPMRAVAGGGSAACLFAEEFAAAGAYLSPA